MKLKKLVLSPFRRTNPSDAVYDWSVGKEFKSEEGVVSISDVDALCSKGYMRLIFTCGELGSSFLDLTAEARPSLPFHPDGIYHTDECEAHRQAFRYNGRDEPLYRGAK